MKKILLFITLYSLSLWGQNIQVDPTSVAFGLVRVGNPETRTITISNNDPNDSLVISSINLTDPGDVFSDNLSGGNFPIILDPRNDPNDEISLEITFDPAAAQNYTGAVTIISDDPPPVDIPLSGSGGSPIFSIDPSQHNFGNSIVGLGNGPERVFTITNSGSFDLTLSASNITGGNSGSFQITSGNITANTTVGPGNTHDITVEFLPQTSGALTSTLQIAHDASGSPASIDLSGNGQDRTISITPGNLTFDNTKVGETSSSKSFFVQNSGDADIAINNVSLTGGNAADFTIVDDGGLTNGSTLTSGQTKIVEIAFQPQSAGGKNANFRITNNSTNAPTLDGGLSGTGTAPIISASPAPLTFGDVILFEDGNDVVTILNTGSATLTLSSVVLETPTGTPFTITAGGGTNLNAPVNSGGAGYPISIRFSPESRGDHSNRIIVTSDDPSTPSLAVTIAGTGVSPEIEITPTQLAFGSIVVGGEVDRMLTISNNGNSQLTGEIVSGNNEFSVVNGSTFTINPGNNVQKTIRFAPANPPGDRTGSLSISHNDVTQSTPITVSMAGRALKDDPVLLPASVNFGPVLINTVSDTVDLTLENSLESEPVTVERVRITGDPFDSFEIISGDVSNFDLNPGESLTVSVAFSESSVRSNDATLEIDVDRPPSLGGDKTYTANLTGRGVKPTIKITPGSIAFDTTAVGSPKIMSTTISNAGGYELSLTNFSINGGTGSTFRVLDNPPPQPLDSGEVFVVRVEFLPADTIAYADVLTITSDDPATSTATVSLSGRGFLRDCAVTDINFPSPMPIDNDAVVTAEVLRGEGISQVTATLLYTQSDGSGFSSASMSETTSGSDSYRGTIPASVIGLTGVKFYIRLNCDNLPPVYSDTVFANVSIPGPTQVPSAGNLTTDRWFMWSVPAELSEPDITDVLSALGPEGDESWRIFRVNQNGSASQANYHDLAGLRNRGDYGQFVPGNAFWIYLLNANSSFPQLSDLTTVDMQQSYDVTLHPGWNQVANPFAFDITWQNNVEVPAGADISVHYREYQSSQGWTNLFTSTTPGNSFTLAPWEGYAINNRDDAPVTIRFYADGIPGSRALGKGASSIQWQLVLSAESNGFMARTAIGAAADARNGQDRYDYLAPDPVTAKDIQMYFAHTDWETESTRYSTDFRSYFAEGARWPLTIRSSSGSVRLTTVEQASLPLDFAARLVDRMYGEVYPIDATQEIVLTQILPEENDRFMVLVGTEDYLDNAVANIDMVVPVAFKLWQNYPNPFNPVTTLAFQLTREGHVNLTIYNVLGQKVKTLVNEQKAAGAYRLTWDGTNGAGYQTASGLYFYRLEAEGRSEIRKMLKVQ